MLAVKSVIASARRAVMSSRCRGCRCGSPLVDIAPRQVTRREQHAAAHQRDAGHLFLERDVRFDRVGDREGASQARQRPSAIAGVVTDRSANARVDERLQRRRHLRRRRQRDDDRPPRRSIRRSRRRRRDVGPHAARAGDRLPRARQALPRASTRRSRRSRPPDGGRSARSRPRPPRAASAATRSLRDGFRARRREHGKRTDARLARLAAPRQAWHRFRRCGMRPATVRCRVGSPSRDIMPVPGRRRQQLPDMSVEDEWLR